MRVLITGGAGFIGSHLVDFLLAKNYEIVVYDVLEPQVHGMNDRPPNYLAKNITFLKNDIRNKDILSESLKDIDAIIHLASMVGVGQSMYQIDKYVDVNILGTARLLDILVNKPNTIKKFVLASSMSTYGEGSYICENCEQVNPELRSVTQLERGEWELFCPICGKKAKPIPTNESKPQVCTSIYALNKKEQEKMCMLIGETYGINTTALRLFNVYGSRQALSNPYTGVCAIFSSRLLNGNRPIIYEDGNQMRDFVHVRDVCKAFYLSLTKRRAKNQIFNVGTGEAVSIKQIAETLARYINPEIKPIVSNKFRPGDIRHCFADISKISSELGYKADITFKEGIHELIEWVKLQQGKAKDKSDKAYTELKEKGLLK